MAVNVAGEGATFDRESTTKRIVRSSGRLATKLAIFGTLGLFSGAALSTVVPTEVPFGPGTARATVTFDGNATLDGGVIGSVQKDINGPRIGPIQLGISLRTNELPIRQPNPGAQEIDELSVNQIFGEIDQSDIQRFGEYSRASTAQVSEITTELRNHSLSMGLLVGAGALALYELPGKKGRKHVKETLKRPQIYLPLVVALYLGQANVPEQPNYNWQETGSEYDGTPLGDVRVSGDIANQFVNNFGSRILGYINQTDAYYARVLRNAEIEAGRTTLLGQRPGDEQYRLLTFFTDNHCNTGTPRIIAYITSESGANVAVDGGDTVYSGSPYERYCVQQEMNAFNDQNIEVVAVQGNHDSDITAEYMEEYGAHMLNGSVINVGGIDFLGDVDPYESRFGQGKKLRGSTTLESLSMELANTACNTADTPILVVHHSQVARQSIVRQCVLLSLSGHTHERDLFFSGWDDQDYLPFTTVTGGTSGGANENSPTYGKLRRESSFMLIAVNHLGQLQALQDITIDVDGEVVIGDIIDNPDLQS
jgi:Icc-related predicted phosphoesterase